MKYVAYIAGAFLLAGAATPALADANTFGQFLQRTPGARLFQYVNRDSGAARKAEIRTTGTASGNSLASIPVYYVMSGTGLPLDLVGTQNAHLTVDFISSLGTTGVDPARTQLFDTIISGTISIVRDTAAAEGTGTRTNLLTVTFTNAQLDANNGAGAFTFKSMANSVINYTSDFRDFTYLTDRDFSLSFSGASPTFNAPAGSSGRTSRFSGTGTFAAAAMPEAATWSMMLIGFGAAGLTMRSTRRRKESLTA